MLFDDRVENPIMGLTYGMMNYLVEPSCTHLRAGHRGSLPRELHHKSIPGHPGNLLHPLNKSEDPNPILHKKEQTFESEVAVKLNDLLLLGLLVLRFERKSFFWPGRCCKFISLGTNTSDPMTGSAKEPRLLDLFIV